MRFTITKSITLTKKEFSKLKEISSGSYGVDYTLALKLKDLGLIYLTKDSWNGKKFRQAYHKVTKLGKNILKQGKSKQLELEVDREVQECYLNGKMRG